eukprot:m.377058 g.377058  ORF g.377058 m.377058 type:complete len:53 (+) comp85268_c0_seq1:86-244(+)
MILLETEEHQSHTHSPANISIETHSSLNASSMMLLGHSSTTTSSETNCPLKH